MKILASLTMVALLSGCSLMAPNYTPSIQSVQAIKNSGANKVSVDKPSVKAKELNTISLRGSTLKSPYGDFTAYIENALKRELGDAGLLDEKSDISIGTVLTKNEMDTSISNAHGDISAIFSVKKKNEKIFEKEVSGHKEWSSSFVGAIAIPNAVNAYPELVSDLVKNLFTDKDFIKAISK